MECPYNDVVECDRKMSMIAGPGKEYTTISAMIAEGGILGEFAKDHDIQEITVVSTNIGFVRTYRKYYKEQETTNATGRKAK